MADSKKGNSDMDSNKKNEESKNESEEKNLKKSIEKKTKEEKSGHKDDINSDKKNDSKKYNKEGPNIQKYGDKSVNSDILQNKESFNMKKNSHESLLSQKGSRASKILKEDDDSRLSQIDEDSESDPTKSKEQKNDVLQDILAEEQRVKEIRTDEEQRVRPTFDRRALMKREVFSVGNMDVYLHYKYRRVHPAIRCFAECIVVFCVLMIWPLILILIGIGKGLTKGFARANLFISLAYTAYACITLFTDRVLEIAAFLLRSADVPIEGALAQWLQIVAAARGNMRNALASLVIFGLAHWLVSPYVWLSSKRTHSHIAMTGALWFGLFSCALFAEKLLLAHLTSELRRRTFRTRIIQANFRSFVIARLAAIAEAHASGTAAVDEAIRAVNPGYDAGFFLRHAELDLTSEKRAAAVGEGILFFLDAPTLTYPALIRFFPDSADAAYAFLAAVDAAPGEIERPDISQEALVSRCIELFQERSDIARSLYYRDMVLRKLDRILVAVVSMLAALAYLTLLRIDYRIYLTSIGPTFIGFGWIFQDSIKEIYRCFVFLLANHPYDCGDRVVIDGEELIVHSIDLLFSTFITQTGKIKYIPNASMFLKPIENIRRSSLQTELVSIRVPLNTPYSRVMVVKDQLSIFLKGNANDFSGSVIIQNIERAGEEMVVTLGVEHNSNFQDTKPRFQRRSIYTEALQDILKDNGLPSEQAFLYSD